MTDEIQFDHYTIRLIRATDAPGYFRLIDTNRSRLEAFFAGTVSKTKTLPDTVVFVADVLQRMESRVYFPFLMLDNNTQQLIGKVDVKNIDWNIPKAELGCFIDEQYAGTGVSQKALSLVIDHLFANYGFNKLFLRTHPTNAAARKVAEKCGFEIEGTIRRDYKTTAGELVDLIYYGLVRN